MAESTTVPIIPIHIDYITVCASPHLARRRSRQGVLAPLPTVSGERPGVRASQLPPKRLRQYRRHERVEFLLGFSLRHADGLRYDLHAVEADLTGHFIRRTQQIVAG